MFQNCDLLHPYVEYDSYEDFDKRLNRTYAQYSRDLAEIMRIPIEDCDVVWVMNMLLAKMNNMRHNNFNNLYELTKKKGSWWCIQTHKIIVFQLELVVKTFMHTLMAHPDIVGPCRASDMLLLKTLVESEVWSILTRSNQVGHSFLRYPFSGEYEGLAGLFVTSCFVPMRDELGKVIHHVPVRVWHEMRLAFVLGCKDETDESLGRLDVDVTRLILDQVTEAQDRPSMFSTW